MPNTISNNSIHYLENNSIYMDEALSKTKFGVFNYILIGLTAAILFGAFVETCSITYVIPISQCEFNMTDYHRGILTAVSFFGIICSSHLWGYLADTQGRRCVIMPTLLVAFLLTCAASLAQNFYVFVTLRFLNGFFIAGPSAAVFAYLSEFHDKKNKDRAIMLSTVVLGIPPIMLPLLAWSIINQDWEFFIPFLNVTYTPWRLFLVICALPSLLSFLVLIFLPESPKFVLSQGNNDQAYEILRKMNRINNGKDAEFRRFDLLPEVESIENRQLLLECENKRFAFLRSVWIQTVPIFKPPYLLATVLICTIQFGIYATNQGFYMFFIDAINKMAVNLESWTNDRMPMCEVINMNTTVTRCITEIETETIMQGLILEILYSCGFMTVGLLVNRIGKFPVLVSILVLSGAGGILCMLTDIPMVQIASFMAHVLCGIATNIVNAATVDNYPTSLRAMAVCISLMVGRIGCVIGANVAALLLERYCETVFYLFGSMMLVIAVLSYFIPNIHNNNDSVHVAQ